MKYVTGVAHTNMTTQRSALLLAGVTLGLLVLLLLLAASAVYAQTPSSAVRVIVLVPTNIRSGAGITNSVVMQADAGAVYDVVDETQNCAWLQITADSPDRAAIGWISGHPAYVDLQGDCAAVAATPPAGAVALPTPTPSTTGAQLFVTVLFDGTPIRAGAGAGSVAISRAAIGEVLRAVGQVGNCTWIQVVTAAGEHGWISGNPAYVAIDQPCASLPQILPTPTPRPTATPKVVAQGCATIINQLGFSVRVDLQRNDGWHDAIALAANARRFYCVNPGRYTITLTSPTRSDSFSLPLVVRGGENYNIPLRLP